MLAIISLMISEGTTERLILRPLELAMPGRFRLCFRTGRSCATCAAPYPRDVSVFVAKRGKPAGPSASPGIIISIGSAN